MMNINFSKNGGFACAQFLIGFTVINPVSPHSDQCHFYTLALETPLFFMVGIGVTQTSLNSLLSRNVNGRSNKPRLWVQFLYEPFT